MTFFLVSLYPDFSSNSSIFEMLDFFKRDRFLLHIPKEASFNNKDIIDIYPDRKQRNFEVLTKSYRTKRGMNWFAIIELIVDSVNRVNDDDLVVILSANSRINKKWNWESNGLDYLLVNNGVAAHLNSRLTFQQYLKLYTHPGSIAWMLQAGILLTPSMICKGQHEGLAFTAESLKKLISTDGWKSLCKYKDRIYDKPRIKNLFPFGFEEYCFPTNVRLLFETTTKPLVEVKWFPDTEMYFDRPFYKIVNS